MNPSFRAKVFIYSARSFDIVQICPLRPLARDEGPQCGRGSRSIEPTTQASSGLLGLHTTVCGILRSRAQMALFRRKGDFRPRLKAEVARTYETPGQECALGHAPPVRPDLPKSSSFGILRIKRNDIRNR